METRVKYFISSMKEKWRMQEAGAGGVLNYHKISVAQKKSSLQSMQDLGQVTSYAILSNKEEFLLETNCQF